MLIDARWTRSFSTAVRFQCCKRNGKSFIQSEYFNLIILSNLKIIIKIKIKRQNWNWNKRKQTNFSKFLKWFGVIAIWVATWTKLWRSTTLTVTPTESSMLSTAWCHPLGTTIVSNASCTHTRGCWFACSVGNTYRCQSNAL